MNRLVALAAIASITFTTTTATLAQGRFGSEAKQRTADREEREAIRRAEHPELYEAAAGKPSESATQAAPAAEPAAEPAPAAQAAAPAQ
ncbi:MAG: hypothetical protein H7X89_16735 [Rhizobiales bacterium]|nr:hypothetical protein [Hyphomicrobiales bacterium]